MGQGDGKVIKVTTIDNPEYQEFEDGYDFLKTGQVLHSYNDKPSYIRYYKSNKIIICEQWYLDGKHHRSNNKPCSIGYYNNGRVCYKLWYLDSKKYSEQEYKQIMKQVKSMSDTEKLLDSRQWVREMAK